MDTIAFLIAQLETLSKQLGKINANSIQINVLYSLCAGNHPSVECQVGGISLLHQAMNKWDTCQILNFEIIHIEIHTILDGGITATFHEATTKGRLDHPNT